MKRSLRILAVLLMIQSNSHAGCGEVVKLVASKSLELSIIVNQKSTEMQKGINEIIDQNKKDIKAQRPSLEVPDLATGLSKENAELNHVNAVLGAQIGRLIKSNPKCFR